MPSMVRRFLQVFDGFEQRDDVDVEARLSPGSSRPDSLSSRASSSRSETPSVFEMMQLGSAAAP
jgi:hypothetical protein